MAKVKRIGDTKIAGAKYKDGQIIETDDPQKFLMLGGFELISGKVERKEEKKEEESIERSYEKKKKKKSNFF